MPRKGKENTNTQFIVSENSEVTVRRRLVLKGNSEPALIIIKYDLMIAGFYAIG